MNPTINPQKLETWASILIEHSLGGVKPEEIVLIRGEHVCWPLMSLLQKKVIEAGGVPDIYLCPPDLERSRVWSGPIARGLTVERLENPPEWMIQRWQKADKFIEILGAEDPSLYADLPAVKSGAIAKAWKKVSEVQMERPWVLTLFPTRGFANMEGMDPQEHADFLVAASTTDPQDLVECQERLRPLFDDSQQVTIVTQHPDGQELTA